MGMKLPFAQITCLALLAPMAVLAAPNACMRQSGATVTPVIELYTSEGCSSCPPADQWVSSLHTSQVAAAEPTAVIQAFHVGYWDYIGWVDRFASPAYTERQKQVASWNGQRGIYTPQAVLNGRDWRDWSRAGTSLKVGAEPAHIAITLKQNAPDQYEATVLPTAGAPGQWSAYWTVTESGHSSKVKAGENAGETLRHDYVVRQYTPAGDYRSEPGVPRKLVWRSVPATPGHARLVNLVVFDGRNGKTLQALSMGC